MSLNRLRCEFAAEGFLRSMRRAYIARNPDGECMIKSSLKEYSEADRSVLINAVESAMKLTDASTDLLFDRWLQDRAETAAQQP